MKFIFAAIALLLNVTALAPTERPDRRSDDYAVYAERVADGGRDKYIFYGDPPAQWAIAITGIVAALFSGLAALLLLVTLSDQRTQFAAERRPWIGITEATIAEPVIYAPGHGLTVKLRLVLKNGGSSPAVGVRARMKVLQPGTKLHDALKQLRSSVLVLPTRMDGEHLLPGDQSAKEFQDSIPRSQLKSGMAMVWVYGVVRYISPIDEASHTTAFVYFLRRRGAESSVLHFPIEGDATVFNDCELEPDAEHFRMT